MSALALEAFLARLYTDRPLRERFLADPDAACADCGLSPDDIAMLRAIDRDGLILAARSYARKRANLVPPLVPPLVPSEILR